MFLFLSAVDILNMRHYQPYFFVSTRKTHNIFGIWIINIDTFRLIFNILNFLEIKFETLCFSMIYVTIYHKQYIVHIYWFIILWYWMNLLGCLIVSWSFKLWKNISSCAYTNTIQRKWCSCSQNHCKQKPFGLLIDIPKIASLWCIFMKMNYTCVLKINIKWPYRIFNSTRVE